jgi:enoyl-CoA hydratase/carnithine racemase
MTEPDVTGELRDSGAGIVEMRRAPHNYLDLATLDQVCAAMAALDSDERCRVIILRSDGKNFCAGRDFSRPRQPGDTSEAVYARAGDLAALTTPWIAQVQGAAVGAGLGLAVLADFRVASTRASFWANFVDHGLHPGFGLTFTLPRVVGAQRAALMLTTARRVFAADARAWGLADELAEPDELPAATERLAQQLASLPPAAVASVRARTRPAGFLAEFVAATSFESSEQARLRPGGDAADVSLR